MRISTLLSAASLAAGVSTAAPAALAEGCAGIVARAGLEAVEQSRPIGQTHVSAAPFAFSPSLQRVEVTVAGAQTLIYDVDVTIDPACKVLGASARLVGGGTLLGR